MLPTQQQKQELKARVILITKLLEKGKLKINLSGTNFIATISDAEFKQFALTEYTPNTVYPELAGLLIASGFGLDFNTHMWQGIASPPPSDNKNAVVLYNIIKNATKHLSDSKSNFSGGKFQPMSPSPIGIKMPVNFVVPSITSIPEPGSSGMSMYSGVGQPRPANLPKASGIKNSVDSLIAHLGPAPASLEASKAYEVNNDNIKSRITKFIAKTRALHHLSEAQFAKFLGSTIGAINTIFEPQNKINWLSANFIANLCIKFNHSIDELIFDKKTLIPIDFSNLNYNDQEFKQRISKSIKEVIKIKGIGPAKLAEELNVPAISLSEWLQQATTLTLINTIKIAKVTGKSLNYIILGYEEK